MHAEQGGPLDHLRVRNGWEAIDHGVAMLHEHGGAVFAPWVAFAVLVHTLLVLGFGVNDWATTALFWWLKPLFDRLLLHLIVGAATGRPVSVAGAFAALPQLVLHTGLGRGLTLLRLSSARAQHLPVWQLERRHGARIHELFAGARPRPIWLMLACVHAELSIYIGPILLALLFAPEGLDVTRILERWVFSPEQQTAVNLVGAIAYLVAVVLIEPIYVAAGYAQYEHQRALREASDLEAPLRRIGTRTPPVRPALLIAALASLLGLSSPAQPTLAAALRPPEETRQALQSLGTCEALRRPQTESMWVPRSHFPDAGIRESPSDARIDVLAQALKAALVVLLGLGVALYALNRRAAREPTAVATRPPPGAPPTAPAIDLAPEALPTDPVAAARARLGAGDARGAVSLLYRAALATLVTHNGLPLTPAHTERDVLRLAQRALPAEQLTCLARLAAFREATAYAHRNPDTAAVEALCDAWQACFGGTP